MNNNNQEIISKQKLIYKNIEHIKNDKNNSKNNNNSVIVEYEPSQPNYSTILTKNHIEILNKLIKPINNKNTNSSKFNNNQQFSEKNDDKHKKKIKNDILQIKNKNENISSMRIGLKKYQQNLLTNNQNNSEFLQINSSNDMIKNKSVKNSALKKNILCNVELYSPKGNYKVLNSIFVKNKEKINVNNQYQQIKLPKISRNDFSSINHIATNDNVISINNCLPRNNFENIFNSQIPENIINNKKLLHEFKRSISIGVENMKISNNKNYSNSPENNKNKAKKNLDNIPELLIINKNYININKNLHSSSSTNKNNKINNTNNIVTLTESNENNNQENSEIRKNSQRKSIVEAYKLKCHFYLILPGNASYLVQNCMCHRLNWKIPYSKVTTLFNFKWKELSSGIDYNSLGKYGAMKQIVNHYENHFSLTNKANMFINFLEYCEDHKISVFKYVPFTIIFDLKNPEKYTEEDKNSEFQKKMDVLQKFIKISKDFVTNFENIGKFYEMQEFLNDQKNREEFNTKQKKNKEINENNQYKGEFIVYSDYFKGLKAINYVHDSYKDNNEFIEKEKQKQKLKNKIIGENTVIEIPNSHFNGKNMWVIKPINLNRGKCIQIANNFKQMQTIINKFKNGVDYDFTKEIIEENQTIDFKKIKNIKTNDKNNNNNNSNNNINNNNLNNNNNSNNNINSNNLNNNNNSNNNNNNNNSNNENVNNSNNNINTNNNNLKEEKERLYNCNKIIIQKYIENPLLYYGRKCDMRIWVLINHQMKVYFFKEGHLKTCSVQYDINSNNAYTHITNYSFQKYNSNFQKFEKGNEVPFYEFQKFIDHNYPEKNYKIKNNLMQQIKEIVNLTTRSVADKINKNKRNCQFEIYGYDFMLDSDFNLFLIEINTNPGLEESSPWIKIIVPRMLDDALRLTIDQIFDPGYDFKFNYSENKKENTLSNSTKNINLNSADNVNLKTIPNNNKTKIINTSADNITIEYSDDKNSKKSQIFQNQNLTETGKEENSTSNNNKYISPFPVPGYNLSENLWEFVCDLNSVDPLDELINEQNEKNKNEAFTGIRHLLAKKKKKKKKNKSKKKAKKDGNKSDMSEKEEDKEIK